jgi:PKD repeat protein
LYLILSIVIGFTSCTKEAGPIVDEEGTLPKPTSSFAYEVVDPNDPFTIKFTNSSTNFADSRWSFDDDSTSSEASPTHTFLKTGTFNVKLVSINEDGYWAQREETVVISPTELVELVATPSGGTLRMSYETDMAVGKTEWFVKQADGTFKPQSQISDMELTIPQGEFIDAYVVLTTPKGSKARLDMLLADLGIVRDLTMLDNDFTVSHENGSGKDAGEGSSKLIDNNTKTKWYVGNVNDAYFYWQFEYFYPQVINGYSMTSGNDSESRDPKTWDVLGSNNGTDWVVLDARADELFNVGGPDPSKPGRNATRIFLFNNSTPYTHYRVNIKARISSGSFQMSEFRMLQLPQ